MRWKRSLAALGFLLLLTSMVCAAKPVDIYWLCSRWSESESKVCSGCPVPGGYEVAMKKRYMTNFRYVGLPRDARYLFDWEFETKSKLVRGGVGHSFGSSTGGLTFGINDQNFAELRAYQFSGGIKQHRRLRTKKIKREGDVFVLQSRYNIRTGKLECCMNGETVFNLNLKDIPGIPAISTINKVAVLTSSGRRSSARAVHEYVKVKGK